MKRPCLTILCVLSAEFWPDHGDVTTVSGVDQCAESACTTHTFLIHSIGLNAGQVDTSSWPPFGKWESI